MLVFNNLFLKPAFNLIMNNIILCITGHTKQPTLPLVRLRVEYSDELEYFNPIRFGQRFCERVANPTEMILLKRERREKKVNPDDPLDRGAMENLLENEMVRMFSLVNF